jgi:hypothetical protein
MSTDDAEPDHHTPEQLRQMSDEEARRTLTVQQYERRESIIDLIDQAEQNQQEWAEEDERVVDLTVHADDRDLGTELDLYGNDVVVRISPDDDEFRAVAERVEDEYGDIDDTDGLPDGVDDELAEALLEMLDLALLEWNGTDWAALTPRDREYVLGDIRDKWGLDGLLLAWVRHIPEAIHDDREEVVSTIESFRNPEWRGRDRPPR